MTDFLLVGLLILVCACVAAVLSGGVKPYAKGEWRWARAHTAAEAFDPPESPKPFTAKDPRVVETLAQLRYARTKMERLGIKPLMRLQGDPRARDVKPAWQRIVPMGQEPAKTTNVRTLSRRTR